MKKKDRFWFFSWWIIPLATFVIYGMCLLACGPFLKLQLKKGAALAMLKSSLFAGVLIWFVLFLINLYLRFVRKKTDFGPELFFLKETPKVTVAKHTLTENEKNMTQRKRAALNRPVSANLLSKEPEGLLVGKHKSKYVRIPLNPNHITHSIVIGAPGTGKSTGPFLSTLIANFQNERPPLTVFALDTKPELAYKSVSSDSPYVNVVNPTDWQSYGWDFYYDLTEQSSVDDVLTVLDTIAISLIYATDEKNEIFANFGRDIFKGLMLYAYYYYHYDFISSLHFILSNNIEQSIQEAMTNSQPYAYGIRVCALLSQFGQKQSQALQSANMVMREHLGIFTNEVLVYNLRDNPKKASPRDLENGISVFLSLPESMLEYYGGVMRLLVNQTIKFFEKRGDMQRREDGTILMLIDEFPRLHKMDTVVQGFATLRSRGVSICIATQNSAQLENIYGQAGMRNILELCQNKIVLGTGDPTFVDLLKAMVGTYEEERISKSTHGGFFFGQTGSHNVAFEQRPIMDMSDFQELNERKKVLLICNGHFEYIDKLVYYEDVFLNAYSEHVIAKNTR